MTGSGQEFPYVQTDPQGAPFGHRPLLPLTLTHKQSKFSLWVWLIQEPW